MDKLVLTITKRTIVEFNLDQPVAERIAADLGYLLACTEDLPAKVGKNDAAPIIEARQRLEALFQHLHKALSR